MEEKYFNELKEIALTTIEDKSLLNDFVLDCVTAGFAHKLSMNEADRDSIIEYFKTLCKCGAFDNETGVDGFGRIWG